MNYFYPHMIVKRKHNLTLYLFTRRHQFSIDTRHHSLRSRYCINHLSQLTCQCSFSHMVLLFMLPNPNIVVVWWMFSLVVYSSGKVESAWRIKLNVYKQKTFNISFWYILFWFLFMYNLHCIISIISHFSVLLYYKEYL